MQLFYSFFKTLVGKEVVVELKNGVRHRWAPRVRDLQEQGLVHFKPMRDSVLPSQILQFGALFTQLTNF